MAIEVINSEKLDTSERIAFKTDKVIASLEELEAKGFLKKEQKDRLVGTLLDNLYSNALIKKHNLKLSGMKVKF